VPLFLSKEDPKKKMGSSSVSRDFSSAQINAGDEFEEAGPEHAPAAPHVASPGHEDVDVPPESPAGSEQSFSDSFDGGSESGAARGAFDPGVIQETPINRALKGKAIENPEQITTEALSHLLRQDPGVEDVSTSNRKPLSPLAKRLMGPAATVLHGVLTPARLAKKAVRSELKAQPQSAEEIDAKVRKRAADERKRELDGLQSPEERKIRQALRGQDRAKREGPGPS
jgi:hypothetical protein